MRGKLLIIKKVFFGLLFFAMAGFFVTTSTAVESLNDPRDTINIWSLGSYAQHFIRFGLPVYSPPVETNEFIFLDFPHYTEMTEPGSITGNYTGTPVYTIIAGSRVRITGIRVAPGENISIRGISGYNPVIEDSFDVYITIATDPDGLNVRNYAHIIAARTDNSIVVTASLEASVGTLRISGISAPNMFISFSDGGTVIGTCMSNDYGVWTQVFPGQNPVEHQIWIYGIDSSNRVTPLTTIDVLTRAYEITTISGIILPPTIELDKDQISRGDPITISGAAPPNYLVKIFTEPPLNNFEVSADANGNYSYTNSDTADLDLGDHKAYSLGQDLFGTQSLMSLTLFFRVTDGAPPGGGGPPCDISRADLSCDSRVDLTDFSILLYYWAGNSVLADINSDSNVNLIDFSIMMFYWEG